jgi:hypothetical protein
MVRAVPLPRAIRVPELRGVYSQARRLADVEAMARDAIALVNEVAPDSFDITVDTRTPLELLDEIEARGREVDAAVARLRGLRAGDAR